MAHYSISEAQLQALQLYVEGNTIEQIADLMHISKHTVCAHLRTIRAVTCTQQIIVAYRLLLLSGTMKLA
jgi:DNA-binding CsgD family transcriptional regulator